MSPFVLDGSFWTSDLPYLATGNRDLPESRNLVEFASGPEIPKGLLLFQTSGSEGQPKWVGITRTAFLASARAVNKHLKARKKDRWLLALPLHHVGGFSILARCHANGASYFHWPAQWSARAFTEVCQAEKITLVSLVPTQVYDLVGQGLSAPKSLRAVIVGGGAMAPELGQKARELGWPVLQSYGMTETSSQVATEPLDHLGKTFDPERLEVLPGWKLSVDEENRLVVRGRGLASGYAAPSAGGWTWEPINPKVGLRTRDCVQLWEHEKRHFLRVVGRESQFLKVKGELLHLSSVQSDVEFLRFGFGISARLVVTPLPDERRDTKLVLVGQTGEIDRVTLREIQTQHNARCEPMKRIHEVVLVPKIPVSDLGKVNVQALRTSLLSAQ